MSEKGYEITDEERRGWKVKGMLLALKEEVDAHSHNNWYLMHQESTRLVFRHLMEEVLREIFGDEPK